MEYLKLFWIVHGLHFLPQQIIELRSKHPTIRQLVILTTFMGYISSLCVYACVSVWTCVCVHASVCLCAWRPEGTSGVFLSHSQVHF